MPEPKDPREPRIPTDSPTFDADNRWTRTWIMYFESLFKLSVKEAVRLAGTVTHIGGALTKDLPVFGNDAGDIKVGTKSGNTNKLITNTGTNVTGNTVKWDANGNLIDAGTAPGGGSGTVTAVTGTAPIASSGGTTPAISIAAFTGDSGSGGAKGAVPAPAAGDAAALKVLGAGGGWVAGGAGTVTHTGGALTADQPVFGAGSADIKVGTKTGNTNKVVTNTGSNVTGNTVKWDASGNLIDAGSAPGGPGTVTSVALTVPAEFSVSGSPVTTSGTLAVSKATQSANAVYAGPASGAAAAPTFRAVVPADLPLASSSAFGAVKVDGTTITAASGVISAVGGGGAYSPYLPTPTVPVSTSFTWSNQSTATVTNKSSRMIMVASGGGVANALIANAALPSTPYTIDLGIISHVNAGTAGAFIAGIVMRNSGNALRTYCMRANNANGLGYRSIQAWTAIASPGAEATTGPITDHFGTLIFFRVTDDGSNRKYYWSFNGLDYAFAFSEATGTGITPNAAGIIMYDVNTAIFGVHVVVHWLVSNSVLAQFT